MVPTVMQIRMIVNCIAYAHDRGQARSSRLGPATQFPGAPAHTRRAGPTAGAYARRQVDFPPGLSSTMTPAAAS